MALFVALGGSAFAATQISGSQIKNNSIAGKKLKNKTITGGKIKNRTITGARVANNTLTGKQIRESSLGTVPNAANLGGVAAGQYAQRLWAVVSTTTTGANVVRSAGAVNAGRISTGNYFVSFNRNITGCAYVATLGDIGFGGGPAGEISVEGRNPATPNDVEIRTRNSGGLQTDGLDFHLVVVC